MRPRVLITVAALGACGRVSFDPLATDAPGHDEDGDGIPDAFDTCPHLVGSQTDTDGDGVGDLCDPEPVNPRQRLDSFLDGTSMTGIVFTPISGSVWTQGDDAIHITSDGGSQQLISTRSYTGVCVAIGTDILGVRVGAQHQLAIHGVDDKSTPHTYTEMNEQGTLHGVQVTDFTGTAYNTIASMPFPMVHPGRFDAATQMVANGGILIAAGWPGEGYRAEVPSSAQQPASHVYFDINGMDVDVRYVWIVTW